MTTGNAAAQFEERTSGRSFWLVALALVVTAVVFSRTLSGGFITDDHLLVQRNPASGAVGQLIGSLGRPMWEFETPEGHATVGYWRPLATVALAVGRWIGGGQPVGFHALCLVVHLLATWAAFRLARRLTQDRTVAFFAALLFGVHPVHVESVAWISAINEPLAGLFALLALDAWVAWRQRESVGMPWSAGVCLLCGLLSKELAAAVILVALAIDVVRSRMSAERKWVPRGARAYVPFAAALGVWLLARVFVFGEIGAGLGRTTTEFGVGFARLLLLRVEILGNGLKLLVWPAQLRVMHPFVPEASWASIGLPALVCAAWATVIVVCWMRRSLLATTAALIAPVALLPLVVRVGALGLFPMAERYLYFAAFGATLLVALEALRLLPRALGVGALAIAAAVLGVRTFERTAVWSEEGKFLATAVEEAPRSPYVRWVRGRFLLDEYRRTHDVKTLETARAQFQEALDLGLAAQKGDDTIFAVSNDFLQANVGMGWSLIYAAEIDEQHDFSPPIQLLEMVVKRYPQSPEGRTALGVAHYLHGDVDEARGAFEQALAIDRNYMEAHTGLGQVWMRRGEFAKARIEFETALRLAPEDVSHYVNLLGAEERMGDDAAALETVLNGLRIAPDDARLLVMHGNLMAKHGNLEPALAEFDRVLRADPQSSAAWLAKGKVLSLKHETTGALRAFQNAAEFDTTSFEAHYNAGMMMLSDPSQDPAVAVQFLVRAYEHRGDSAAGAGLRETLLKLPIESPAAYYTLAMSDALRHELDPALEWTERALKLKPDDGDALFLKGRLLQEKGDREGALAELKKACAVLPDSAQAYGWTGDLLAQMGNREEARAYLEKALAIARRLAPSDPEMRDILPAIEAHVKELTDPKK